MAETPRIAPQAPDTTALTPPRRHEFIPVDTMIHAQEPGDPNQSDFAQLARVLGQINPEINRLYVDQTDRYVQGQQTQGRDQAIKSGLAYGEAVQRGIIDPNQSPIFMRAWKEIDGANMGDAIAQKVQTTYETDPIKNSTDPGEFQKWVQGQIQPQLAGVQDKDIMAGLAPKMQQLQGQLAGQQKKQAASNAWNGMQDSAGTQLGTQLSAYLQDVKTSGGQYDPAQAATIINNTMSLPNFAGLDPQTSQKVVAKAVANAAMVSKDPNVLSALNEDRPDRLNPGQTIPGYGQTTEGKALIYETTKHIQQQVAEDQNRAWMAEEHQRTTSIRVDGGNVMDNLYHNQTPDPAAIDRWIHADPGAADKIVSFKNAQMKNTQELATPAFAKTLNTLINPDANGVSRVERLTQAVANGSIKVSQGQLETLYKSAREWDNAGVETVKPVSIILQSLEHDGDPTSGLPAMFKDADAKLAVKANFMSAARDIIQKNKGVDPDTLMPQLTTARDQAIDAYAKLYPAAISFKPEGVAHSSVDLGVSGKPMPTPTAPPETPPERPDGTPGNPSFGQAPDERIKNLTTHMTDQRVVNKFVHDFGMREYVRVKRTIQ